MQPRSSARRRSSSSSRVLPMPASPSKVRKRASPSPSASSAASICVELGLAPDRRGPAGARTLAPRGEHTPSGCAQGAGSGRPPDVPEPARAQTLPRSINGQGGAVQHRATSQQGSGAGASRTVRRPSSDGWRSCLVSVVVGFNVLPQKQIDQKAAGPGESGQAAKVINGAFEDKAARAGARPEQRALGRRPRFKAAVADVTERLEGTKGVDDVVGPYEAAGQVSADGHSALVTFELPGDSKTTKMTVVGLAGRRGRGREGASASCGSRRRATPASPRRRSTRATRRWASPHCSRSRSR